MGWLNRLSKGVEELGKSVEQGVNRATSEADKALKLNRVSGEISAKQAEVDRTFAIIGHAAYSARDSGATLPEDVTSHFATIDTLYREIKELEAQRDTIKSTADAGAQQSQPQAYTPPAPAQTYSPPVQATTPPPMDTAYTQAPPAEPATPPSSPGAEVPPSMPSGSMATSADEAGATDEEAAMCEGCGKPLPAGVAFCPGCGHRVA